MRVERERRVEQRERAGGVAGADERRAEVRGDVGIVGARGPGALVEIAPPPRTARRCIRWFARLLFASGWFGSSASARPYSASASSGRRSASSAMPRPGVRVGELRVERERAVVARRARAPGSPRLRSTSPSRECAGAKSGSARDRALELGLRLGEPARVEQRRARPVVGEPGALAARERPVHGERRGETREQRRRRGGRARPGAQRVVRARARPPRRAASARARAGSGSARTRRRRRRSRRARAPSPAGARAAARRGAPRARRPARAAPTHRSGTATHKRAQQPRRLPRTPRCPRCRAARARSRRAGLVAEQAQPLARALAREAERAVAPVVRDLGRRERVADRRLGERARVLALEARAAAAGPQRLVAAARARVVADPEVRPELRGGQQEASAERRVAHARREPAPARARARARPPPRAPAQRRHPRPADVASHTATTGASTSAFSRESAEQAEQRRPPPSARPTPTRRRRAGQHEQQRRHQQRVERGLLDQPVEVDRRPVHREADPRREPDRGPEEALGGPAEQHAGERAAQRLHQPRRPELRAGQRQHQPPGSTGRAAPGRRPRGRASRRPAIARAQSRYARASPSGVVKSRLPCSSAR